MSSRIDSSQLAIWLALILAIIGGVFYLARLEKGIGDNTKDIQHQREVIDLKLSHIVIELRDIKAQTARD